MDCPGCRRSCFLSWRECWERRSRGNATTTRSPDADYLNAAHQINLTIIQAGQAAKTQGRTSCERRAGAVMERDHRRLAAQELEVAGRLGIGLVSIPSLAQRQKLDALAAKAGTSGYDAAWLVLQRQEHQQYLTLIGGDLVKASAPAVESVAKGAQPVIQMHLRMVAGPGRAGTGTPIVPTGDGGQMADVQKTRSRTGLVLFGLGVLLLAGERIGGRRRLVGLAAMEIGVARVFGGRSVMPERSRKPALTCGTGSRRSARPAGAARLCGRAGAARCDRRRRPAAGAEIVGRRGLVGGGCGAGLCRWHCAACRACGLRQACARGVRRAVASACRGQGRGDRRGGDVHWYRIVARRTYRQEALPADLFHGAAKPRLALVTCIGAYDHATRRYAQNLVLYGVPVD